MKVSRPESIIAVLSVDVLVQILSHVASSADRKSFRLVSRTFLVAESVHRRSLRPLYPNFLPPLLGFRYRCVDSLDLSVCSLLDDAALSGEIAGGGYWKRLRRVGLARASLVGWKGIQALVEACPLLEELDLSYCCGIGDREAAELARASGLRDLRLDKCLGVTDVGLARVAVACGGLEILGIKWCMEISDIGIDLLAKKCRSLRVLDLSYLKVTNTSLRAISSLEKFEALSLVGCRRIDDEGLAFLNNGTNSLQSIDISRCEKVTWFGIASVIDGNRNLRTINMGDCSTKLSPDFFSNLNLIKKSLRSLKLSGLEVLNCSLRSIGSNCSNLVEISLSKCIGLTDEGIDELVSRCARLRVVDLTCCLLLTDAALSSIAKFCSHLACLKLEACSLMSEKGFARIAAGCSQLQEIDLTDCSISDTALQHLSKCSYLKILKLGLCAEVTGKGLAFIGSNCENLEELDLYRCVEVDDRGLSFLAEGCKKLRRLNLCYCTQITDIGLKHLSCLEGLSDLEMRGLVNVTSIGIASIALGCRSLVELDLKRCSSVDDYALFALAQHSLKLRQINISNCPVSGVGLYKMLGGLRCLQDAKLVQLERVSVQEFEVALRASRCRLKKLKLIVYLRKLLSPGLLQMLQAKGCRIRWAKKLIFI